MFHTEYIVALFFGIAWHIIKGFTLGKQHFKHIALGQLRQFYLCLHKCHGAVLPCNV